MGVTAAVSALVVNSVATSEQQKKKAKEIQSEKDQQQAILDKQLKDQEATRINTALQAKNRARQKTVAATAAGRSSTLLTGTQGVAGVPSSPAAFVPGDKKLLGS